MAFIRQSVRTKPPFGELGDPPLPEDGTIFYEEEYAQTPIKKLFNKQIKQQESPVQIDAKRVLDKTASKKELVHAELIERFIVEGSRDKQRHRSISSSKNSYSIDDLLQNENNDWYFEKILEKFESLRSKQLSHYETSSSNDFDDNIAYGGVERIVERRYYVKKSKSSSLKRDQLTSTSDLRQYGKKRRQLSGVSSVTTASTEACSQCSSSTPSYVENLRDQSDSLRNEISELKSEIEHLQTSQQQFFQQLRAHLQLNKTLPATLQNMGRPESERGKTFGNSAIPLSISQRSSSVSTESLQSSPSSSTSGNSTPAPQSPTKPAGLPLRVPVKRTSPISEFTASKNPSIAPTPPVSTYAASKTSSVARTSPISEFTAPKNPSIAPTPPVTTYAASKTSSIAPTSPISEFVASKKPSSVATSSVAGSIGPAASRTSSVRPTPPTGPRSPDGLIIETKPTMASPIRSVSSRASSVAPTPPIAPPMPTNLAMGTKPPMASPLGPSASRSSSVAPTPPVAPPMAANWATGAKPPIAPPMPANLTMNAKPSMASPMPSTHTSVYQNELAHRRVLSPRSQIVASSASIQESSDLSSESIHSETTRSNFQKLSKGPSISLHDNDLNNLVRYSSKLELSGFPSSRTPIITDPNNNSSFWNSVDQFIETSQSIILPSSILQSNNGCGLGLNSNTTKQLDKYDLEIKPQKIVESSAPFLMPPFDTLP